MERFQYLFISFFIIVLLSLNFICSIDEDLPPAPRDLLKGESCLDTDGGINYTARGTTTGYNQWGDHIRETDYCLPESRNTLLVETFCNTTTGYFQFYLSSKHIKTRAT